MPWRKTEAMDQRMEFCLKALRGSNFRQLCREYDISTKTGYKWRERFLERGYQGLEELSRRPHKHPEQVEGEQVCAIVKLKQQFPFWGARKIAELYRRRARASLSESTVKRILERSGLVKKRTQRKASQSGRLSSGRKAQAVNEVWTVDFKGWWWQGTQRCQPLSVRDEYSRYILGSYEPCRMDEARQCERALRAYLNAMGCPRQSEVTTALPLAVARQCGA